MLLCIRFYWVAISRFLPSMCRFSPTCSHYAFQAINQYGTLKGLWLSLKRISKCQPFGSQGYDPVP
ncbi:MAG: membrane protein insertion efficiency factor YidD [SAR202 cluster bacterium]|nr:membrane protein insertion efficiency factor YidD [SAR202 cluster bacterium]